MQCTKKKNIARARKAQGAQACSKLPWEYAYQRLRIKKDLVGGKNIYPYYMCWSPKQYKDTFRNSTQYQRIILKMTEWSWACLELKS